MEIKELLKDYPEFEDETLIISSLEKDPNFKNAKSATDWARKTYKGNDYVTEVGDLVLANYSYSVLEMLFDDYDWSSDISLSERDNRELVTLSCQIFDKSDDLSDSIRLASTNDNKVDPFSDEDVCFKATTDGTVDVFSNEDVCFRVSTGFYDPAAFVLTMFEPNDEMIEKLNKSNVFELAGKIKAAVIGGEHEYLIYRNKITPMIVVLDNLEQTE